MTKPFSNIMVMVSIDGDDALRAHAEIWDFDVDAPGLNLDPVANRRAMYAVAGKLAESGYDVGVFRGDPDEMWVEVVVGVPKELDAGGREKWAYDARQVWDKVTRELGLEYIG